MGALGRLIGTGFQAACRRIPTACPLCACPARGGCVCTDCQQEFIYAKTSGVRCSRCDLAGFSAAQCPDCLALAPAFERVLAAFDYAKPGDVLIQQFKQHRFQYGRVLADLLAAALAQSTLPPWWTQAVLVPIPSTAPALRRRGFNPAAELARQLSWRLALPVRQDCLQRSPQAHARLPQKRLSRQERLWQQQGGYVCRGNVQDAHIVLVDDVMTSGATLHSAAQVLREAGAATVWGLVAARTPFDGH